MDIELVHLEAGYCLGKRTIHIGFEPSRRTPMIVLGVINHAMVDWIVIDIIQPRQVGSVERNQLIPVLIPDFPPRSIILAIDSDRRSRMQVAYELPKGIWLGWNHPDEMVVIGHDGPCLQLHFVLLGKLKEQGHEPVFFLR